MGVCFYFLTVLEGDADVVCSVDSVPLSLLDSNRNQVIEAKMVQICYNFYVQR